MGKNTTENNNVQNKSNELAKILRSFDANNTNSEISTFLEFFERQASRVNEKKKRFCDLLGGIASLRIRTSK